MKRSVYLPRGERHHGDGRGRSEGGQGQGEGGGEGAGGGEGGVRRVDHHDNGRVGAHTGSLVRMSLLHLAALKVLRPLLFEYHSQVALEARKIRRTTQKDKEDKAGRLRLQTRKIRRTRYEDWRAIQEDKEDKTGR